MLYSRRSFAWPRFVTFRLCMLIGTCIASLCISEVNAQDVPAPNGAASAGRVALAVHDSESDLVARQIIEATNVRSRLCLHVGSRDGRLTAAIAALQGFGEGAAMKWRCLMPKRERRFGDSPASIRKLLCCISTVCWLPEASTRCVVFNRRIVWRIVQLARDSQGRTSRR